MATKSTTKGKAAPAPTKGRTSTPAPATRPTTSRPVNTGRGTAAAPARTRTAPTPAPEPEVEETQEAEVVDQEFTEEQNDIAEESAAISGDEILDLSTEELDSPARKADAHRGTIVGIEEFHSEQKGTPAIRILLHSDDSDFDAKMDVYVPLPFEENIRINPRELCKVKNEETGEKNEQLQFAMGIHNKKNDATVDKLRIIARGEGRSLADYEQPVETFSDYCAALNSLCSDLPVVFLRNPQKDAPQFLEVRDILPMSVVEDPKAQGKFKGRLKAWENQE